MSRAKKKSQSQTDAWIEKLDYAFESANRIPCPERERDVSLAIRIIEHALMIAGVIPEGAEPATIEVQIDEPECFACGRSTLERGWPFIYCSKECREFARAVLYIRRKVDKEVSWDRNLLIGAGQKAFPWVSSGHAYDRYVPRNIRKKIFERDGGECVKCGAPATDIDHIKGGSPDPENLQALCSKCNREKMLAGLRRITNVEKRQASGWRFNHLAAFIAAPVAPSPAFDVTWNKMKQQEYSATRKKLLSSQKMEAARQRMKEFQSRS